LGQNVSTGDHFRELGRFIASYVFWILFLGATNVVVWFGMECAWRTWPPNDVWAVRMTGHKTESVYRRYAIADERDLKVAVKGWTR
jgi:hypothetical protein